jgi:hypothetical protein
MILVTEDRYCSFAELPWGCWDGVNIPKSWETYRVCKSHIRSLIENHVTEDNTRVYLSLKHERIILLVVYGKCTKWRWMQHLVGALSMKPIRSLPTHCRVSRFLSLLLSSDTFPSNGQQMINHQSFRILRQIDCIFRRGSVVSKVSRVFRTDNIKGFASLAVDVQPHLCAKGWPAARAKVKALAFKPARVLASQPNKISRHDLIQIVISRHAHLTLEGC